ncbi:MAG TPA: ATP-binding cassette domain-containing protein, partial [Niallia sp.]|nr:ATP-binding cassette domain-containing protein [Niallia sp.]
MITVTNVGLRYGDRKLFEDVNIKFTPGNCYGLIGANGAGKSTFLKILSGELEAQSGNVALGPGERLAILKQNHFEYEEHEVLKVVIMGHTRLYEVMQEKDAIYMKENFTDEDGMKAAELEGEFAELNGWEAESEAAILLKGLGIGEDLHHKTMAELSGSEKVKVLLAQALFGQPDVLLLDEPTNHLDLNAIKWLEEFLINFENTVIVVSHDRHFLNKVCTHIADLDYSKIQIYVGNYDFWYESSQLASRMANDANKKKEEKIKELQNFIARFSANASKSKQATSRKKLLDKISLDDIKPSSRKYPYVAFTPDREIGNDLLRVEGLSKTIDGEKVLDNISFTMNKDDKIALVGTNELAKTTLFRILAGELEPDSGSYKWGVTTSQSYFPADNSEYFTGEEATLVEWLRQYSPNDETESFLRGFLGRMLFSGEEVMKNPSVLSGGEKVRCMLSKMMLSGSNVLLLDEPTNHLD